MAFLSAGGPAGVSVPIIYGAAGAGKTGHPAGHWPAVKIQLNREQEAAFSPLFPVKNTT